MFTIGRVNAALHKLPGTVTKQRLAVILAVCIQTMVTNTNHNQNLFTLDGHTMCLTLTDQRVIYKLSQDEKYNKQYIQRQRSQAVATIADHSASQQTI